MRKLAADVSVVAAVLLAAACGSDLTGPSEPDGMFGWVVGMNHDGYGMILATGNGGVDWQRQGTGAEIPDAELECVRAVDSLVVWAVGDPAGGYGVILRTENGGASWSRQGSSSTLPPSGLNGISPLDSQTAWAVGMDNTILYTSDGGVTWASASDPAFDGYDYDGVFAVDAANIWVAGGTEQDGILLRSRDGGGSWESQGDSVLLQGYPLISISAVDAQRAMVVGHGYTVARTVDGGETWDLCVPSTLVRSTQSEDANGVVMLSPTRAMVTMDYGRIFLTSTGGDAWSQQTLPGAATGYFYLGCCAVDENHLWAVGSSDVDENGVVLHSSDGGVGWGIQVDASPANGGFRDIHFVGADH